MSEDELTEAERVVAVLGVDVIAKLGVDGVMLIFHYTDRPGAGPEAVHKSPTLALQRERALSLIGELQTCLAIHASPGEIPPSGGAARH